jgi:ribose 5-phosphate isomerase B
MNPHVIIGADHGGFELKNSLVAFLKKKGYDVSDAGPSFFDAEDDYPDFARKVAETVGKDGREIGQQNVMGILICRSAGGVIIAANKLKGVRAVAAFDDTGAKHSRAHNDANVLGLSGDWTPPEEAERLALLWLETPYSNEERHTRRLKKILALER